MVHYISLKEIRVKNISASGQSRYLFESTGIYQVTFQPWRIFETRRLRWHGLIQVLGLIQMWNS